jgi:hypothetical protein
LLQPIASSSPTERRVVCLKDDRGAKTAEEEASSDGVGRIEQAT